MKCCCWNLLVCLQLLQLLCTAVDCRRVRHHSPSPKHAMKFLRGIGVPSSHHPKHRSEAQSSDGGGLWPSVFNLAAKAVISANATCGEGGREEFCRMHDAPARGSHRDHHLTTGGGRCGVCDNFSPDASKRHPINYAIDNGSHRWWQSPPLFYGPQYEHVTITLDLKQVYQVAYVTIKAANSPRPGAWILERSQDGVSFEAWQYFAISDKDCMDRYGVPARKGKPHYFTDSEVICTSYHSKLMPLENGEIHTFLIHGRPGANETSPELLHFTRARFVRFRFQALRARSEPLPATISQDINWDKKLFYSIRDVRIGGQCVCNGHASHCRHNVASGNLECECSHHTCGPNCDSCCPMYNQRQWGMATSRDSRVCLPCNCHGMAKSCHYDDEVDRSRLSLDANGFNKGGGVCDNCTKHTTGINCEKCVVGYFRPPGAKAESEVPCVKCDCDPHGSTGECYLDGSNPLTCQCKTGFSGLRCDQCAESFHGYPHCERCPCNPRGTVMNIEDGSCEGDCTCKTNVEGKYCDKCKPGFFSLQSSNPYGCAACYCSDVTSVCASAFMQPQIINFNIVESWLITDISVKELERPLMDDRGMLTVGNNEIVGIEAYYWLAPHHYAGNKLSLYGAQILYKVHWAVMRGDTSGKPTTGPNVILVGGNGMRIACGDDYYTSSNMTFLITLNDYQETWYHVPEDVDDIVTRLRRTEYKGDVVSRAQFMSVLSDLRHVLLRAKFHTDQIEVSLEEVVLYTGNWTDGYGPVEECSCPSGYTGLSCELCQYGHVRIVGNTSTHETKGYCVKCDCNGHSATCDAESGQCVCEHNTIGEHCERCAPGFYGNPLLGTADDCKRCACPFAGEENNFSASCQLDSGSISMGYVCTQCPRGYTGDHCEVCDDGHYGTPSVKGGRCRACECNGSPCDRTTGQCLSCRGNTEGWRCDRCKENYFGDPRTGCESCQCDLLGAESPLCNNVTGECPCKDHFIERTCNKCEMGYGNTTALCVPCSCDPVGSTSRVCDQTSGLCSCQQGVEGFRCDACQHLFYGFSSNGCSSCNCSPRGSELPTCHIATGQCRCKSNYVGLTCSKCKEGYYETMNGCVKCNCDSMGSESELCENESGQCACKPGVDGRTCNVCRTNYYGFSQYGCRLCDRCDKKGHICDSMDGRCVCPPNSYGESCTLCKSNHWGVEPGVGCRPCNCSETGRLRSQCDQRTGICTCLQGYQGAKCDQCSHGYFGYPKCKRCNCHYPGTHPHEGRCDPTGICQCNAAGMCPCKKHVIGRRCNQCAEGTFGLHLDNQLGCTECFCFGRSEQCTEAGYTWGIIRMMARTLSIGFTDTTPDVYHLPLNQIDMKDFEVIPNVEGNVSKPHDHYPKPLYWLLPPQYTGDRIHSYGGYLRFTLTINPLHSENELFLRYPLIRIEGNSITLVHFQNYNAISDHHEVRLHESNWLRESYNGSAHVPITRATFMVTLQNVTGFYIKATNQKSFESTTLLEIEMDNAIKVYGSPPPLATEVELCTCPKEFNGTSCQNPSLGNYREKRIHHIYRGPEDIENVIGTSKPCSCNGRSKVCEIETGHCYDCAQNTSGRTCEQCAEGFYGDPSIDICRSCACPSLEQNFAATCHPIASSSDKSFQCICKQGYEGSQCERCSAGYYRESQLQGGKCLPCKCSPEGSITANCESPTGTCSCKSGLDGQKCDECIQRGHILHANQCVPCDTCVLLLFDDLHKLSLDMGNYSKQLETTGVHAPWDTLTILENTFIRQSDRIDMILNSKRKFNQVIDGGQLDLLAGEVYQLRDNFTELRSDARRAQSNAKANRLRADGLMNAINETHYELAAIQKVLNDFGTQYTSTKDALRRGHKLFDEMRKNKPRWRKTNEVKRTCENYMHLADSLEKKTRVGDFSDLRSRHEDLARRLAHMKQLVNELHAQNASFKTMHQRNQAQYEKMLAHYDNLQLQAVRLNDSVHNHHTKLEDIRRFLNSSQLLDLHEVEDLIGQLEDRISQDDLIEVTILKQQLDEHNAKLSRKVAEYSAEMEKVRSEIEGFKASGRFKESPVENVRYANETYQKAREIFDEIIENTLKPHEGDPLLEQSKIIDAALERELRRIEIIKAHGSNLTDGKTQLEIKMNELKQQNWKNGLANNNQMEKLNTMKIDTELKVRKMKEIREIIRSAVNALEETRNIYKRVTDLNITRTYNLAKAWEKFLNLSSEESTALYKNKVRLTTDLLTNATRLQGGHTNSIEVLYQNQNMAADFQRKKQSIEDKLTLLRSRILKASHIASMIPIPLKGTSCGRRYNVSNFEPSTHLNISSTFTFDAPNADEEKVIFSIRSATQFIRLYTNREQLICEWSLDRTGHHKHMIAQLQVTDNVYKCTLEMDYLNHLLKIHFREPSQSEQIKSNEFQHFKPTLDLIALGHGIFEVGVDNGRLKGLPGCVQEITINGRALGLWEFARSDGDCGSCKVKPDVTHFTYAKFNGDGYATFAIKEGSSKVSMSFEMQTYDENATILTLIDPNDSYISIYLQTGKLHLEMFYNDKENNKTLRYATNSRYNNGSEVKIEFNKKFESRIDYVAFIVNGGVESVSWKERVPKPIKVRKAQYYLGGFPPDLDKKKLPQHIVQDKFCGILKPIIDNAEWSALKYTGYNIQNIKVAESLSYSRILLDVPGSVVKLKQENNKLRGPISFIVRPMADTGQVFELNSILKFRLERKLLHVLLGDELIVASNEISDFDYIHVRLDKELCSLYINNVLVGKCKTAINVHELRRQDGLTIDLGGPNSLRCLLKDIKINSNELCVNADTYVSHQHAGIGRSKTFAQRQPAPILLDRNVAEEKITDLSMKDMSPQLCEVVSYSFEPDAYNFGDSRGFISYSLQSTFWKSNSSIEFEFRTYSKMGLLFLAHGNDHYNYFLIHNRAVQLLIKGKKMKELKTEVLVDDGKWHRVVLRNMMWKKKRKMHLNVDGVDYEAAMPRNKVHSALFFGNVPEKLSQNYITEQFRGCIRALKINGIAPNLFNDKKVKHVKIGQCFASIEPGNYFRGDSFAVYDRNFKLNNFLDIAFEIRTDQQNGVLLSVSQAGNSPALSIELQNGAVVMSVDMGNGNTANVSKLPINPICNNEWHKIEASFTNELSVRVDGVLQIWVLSGAENLKTIVAPLFIGGLPDSAPSGTLKIRENFKGCIRNLAIDSKLVDFTSSTIELMNVLVNSCPVRT